MKHDWNMPHRAESCVACQRAFAVGEAFRVFLYETPEGYQRRDYCTGCPPDTTSAALAVWKTHRPEPVTKKAVPFDRDAIYAFFERLDEANDRQRQLRFVLALLLWRKRVLRLDQTVASLEGEVWSFTAVRGAANFRVTRPELDEEQLERLSTQLEQLLATGAADLEFIPPTAAQEDIGE